MINSKSEQNADNFISFCNGSITSDIINTASKLSHTQSEDSLWFQLRYGRITASKVYEMSVCKKSNGSLVNQIIGAAKKFTSIATTRGNKLEIFVLAEVEKKLKTKIQ